MTSKIHKRLSIIGAALFAATAALLNSPLSANPTWAAGLTIALQVLGALGFGVAKPMIEGKGKPEADAPKKEDQLNA